MDCYLFMQKGSKKILLVGSPFSAHKSCHQCLEGYEVQELSHGKSAEEQLRKNHFDLVIVDANLPDGCGLTFLKKILQETKKHLASILVIDEGQEKMAVEAMKNGVCDCLTKQELVPAILAMSVTRALENKKWEYIHHHLSLAENDLALHDPVTQLYNRDYFATRLHEEMQRSERYDFALTLLIFKIDQFTEIKKSCGEDKPDKLLKELGQLVIRDVRSCDLVARTAEDQFVMLLPHTNISQARSLWQRISQLITKHAFVMGSKNIYITVKAALGSLNKEIETIDEFLENIGKNLGASEYNAEPLILDEME